MLGNCTGCQKKPTQQCEGQTSISSHFRYLPARLLGPQASTSLTKEGCSVRSSGFSFHREHISAYNQPCSPAALLQGARMLLTGHRSYSCPSAPCGAAMGKGRCLKDVGEETSLLWSTDLHIFLLQCQPVPCKGHQSSPRGKGLMWA